MLAGLVMLIVYVVVLGLIYWGAEYLLRLFPLPEPISRIIRIAVIVIIVLVIIGLLLSISGIETGLPRLRGL